MRYAIFSDIHSNWEALQAVFQEYLNCHIDAYVCVGDVVGYGANPTECMAFLKQRCVSIVAGNHDLAVAEKFELSCLNPIAQKAVLWTQKQLSLEEKNFLSHLSLVFKNPDLIAVHGSMDDPRDFFYLTTISQARLTFRLMDRQVCFIGHTHLPQIFIEHENRDSLARRNRISFFRPQEKCIDVSMDLKIKLNSQARYIVNVGSVGQPRDRNPLASYCIYDTELKTIELKRVFYDIKTAQRKIIDAGLPVILAERLAEGY